MRLEKDMYESYGWLLPNGDFYSCDFLQHWRLAKKILNAKGIIPENDPEEQVENMGWIKIASERFIYAKKPITQKQRDKLFDYSECHGINFNDLFANND